MTDDDLREVEERHQRVSENRMAHFDEWNTDAHADRGELIDEVKRLRGELTTYNLSMEQAHRGLCLKVDALEAERDRLKEALATAWACLPQETTKSMMALATAIAPSVKEVSDG